MSTSDGQMYFDDLPAPSYSAVLTAEEIFAFADAAFMAGIHESSQVEKKSSRIQPKQLAEYLSMWANTTGSVLNPRPKVPPVAPLAPRNTNAAVSVMSPPKPTSKTSLVADAVSPERTTSSFFRRYEA